jgi:hypothetical protein
MLDRNRLESHKEITVSKFLLYEKRTLENFVCLKDHLYDLSLYGGHCFKLTLSIESKFYFFHRVVSGS